MSDTATQRFYGVTSITKLGMGTGYSLVEWNARMPAETAFDRFGTLQAFVNDKDRSGAVKWLMESRYAESGAAKARGSEIHAAAEKLALGIPPEVDVSVLPYVEQYVKFLEQFEPMPETDGALAIMLSPADFRIIPVRTDDEVFRCFLAARECARFNVAISRHVFGPEITTRAKEIA